MSSVDKVAKSEVLSSYYKNLSRLFIIKRTCSGRGKLILLWTLLNREVKIFLSILSSFFSIRIRFYRFQV